MLMDANLQGEKMLYDFLVNKKYPLSNDYVPENLVEYKGYNGVKIDPDYKTQIVAEVLENFKNMQQEAAKANVYLVLDSGYRSYKYQEKILENAIQEKGNAAYSYVALPGTSEHQSGLAIDLAIVRNIDTDDFNDENYPHEGYCDDFDDSYPEMKWINDNAYKYGFILRYPMGKESITGFNYEYWHIRYVGKEASYYMHDNKIETLEEYHIVRKKSCL